MMTLKADDVAIHKHGTFSQLRKEINHEFSGKHLASFPEMLDVLGYALKDKDRRVVRCFMDAVWPDECIITNTGVLRTENGIYVVHQPALSEDFISLGIENVQDLENRIAHGDERTMFIPDAETAHGEERVLRSSREVMGYPLLNALIGSNQENRLIALNNFRMLDSRSLQIESYPEQGQCGVVSFGRKGQDVYVINLGTCKQDSGTGLFVAKRAA